MHTDSLTGFAQWVVGTGNLLSIAICIHRFKGPNGQTRSNNNQKSSNGPESKILLCWLEKNTFSPPLFREKILYLVNTNFGLKVSVFVLLQQFVTALGKNCNGYRKNWFLLGILHWITTPNGKYYRVNSKKVPKLSWLAITRAIVKY